VVQRLAGAAEHPRELLAHPAQARELLVDLVDLLCEPDADRLLGTAAPGEPRVLGDLVEREPEALRLLDRPYEAHGLLVVDAVPVRPAPGLRQQPTAFVVAERLDVHSGAAGNLSDPHAEATLDPYLGTDVKARSGPQVRAAPGACA
jgi:hypothetical protein